MKIEDIDKNFRTEKFIEREGLEYHSVFEEPFSIHGVFYDDGCFRRMPEIIASSVSEGVKGLSRHTAGGRIRFCTDSPFLAVYVKYNDVGQMGHFPLSGSAGLDFYDDTEYIDSFIPWSGVVNFEAIADFPADKMHDVTVNMPTYSGVNEIYIGVKENSVLENPVPYVNKLPVVYYGSSITQGGCCSRPGCTYEQIISSRLNCDYVNLGFSGNAKGEQTMVEYLAGLPMCGFVLDYDHNADTSAYLESTHCNVYREIRKSHPDIPILLATRPKKHLYGEETDRVEIVRKTYEAAIADGDKNVYFVAGNDIFPERYAEFCLVDNCHPSDAGFVLMADAFEPFVKLMIGENK